MAKDLKRASLLSEADKQKLLAKASAKKPVARVQTSTDTTTRRAEFNSSPLPIEQQKSTRLLTHGKIWLVLLLIMLCSVALLPKPKLIEYQSAGLVTQSIYIPGFFGRPAVILDTRQRAILAEDEQSLYLCFEGQSTEQCAKYQLLKIQGWIAAALFWYQHQH